jgi:predicted outer membrane repeat protein
MEKLKKVLRSLVVIVAMFLAGGTAFGATDVGNFAGLQNAFNSASFDIQLTNNITWTSVLNSRNSGAIRGGAEGSFRILSGWNSYQGFRFDDSQTVQFSGNINFNNFIDNSVDGGVFSLERAIVDFQTTSTFSNNQTKGGGAIYLNGISDSVTKMTFNYSSITFVDNISQGAGGAIIAQDEAELEIENSYVNFIHNKAYGLISGFDGGGAINVARDSAQLSVDNSKVYFSNNEAAADGGAIEVGFTIPGYACPGTAIFTNSNIEFLGNIAGANGGAIAVVSGSALTFQDSDVSFADNTAGTQGGAIAVVSSELTFQDFDVSFVDNIAGTQGGAIYVYNSNFQFIALNGDLNLTFSNNTAGTQGGAIYIDNSSGFYFNAINGDLNLTFSNNKANGALNDIFVLDGQIRFSAYTGRTIRITSGLISNGNAGLTGDGTLLLNGRVDFDSISIQQGTVEVGNAILNAETIDILPGTNLKLTPLDNATINSNIAGAGNITKDNEGSAILNDAVNISGNLTINAGELIINPNITIGVLTIDDGAKLTAGGDLGQTINAASADINGEIEFDIDFTNGRFDKIIAAGNITFTGTSILTINDYSEDENTSALNIFQASNIIGNDIVNYNQLKYVFNNNGLSLIQQIEVNESNIAAETDSDNFVVKLETDISASAVKISIETHNGLINGKGKDLKGDNGVGFTFDDAKVWEFDNVNFTGFRSTATSEGAITAKGGSEIIINSGANPVSFIGNTVNDVYVDGAALKLQATSYDITFNSGIGGAASGDIEKTGKAAVVIGKDAIVDYQGDFKIKEGTVQLKAQNARFGDLTVSAKGTFSTASNETAQTSTITVNTLTILGGTLEIRAKGSQADVIYANEAKINGDNIIVNPFGTLSINEPILIIGIGNISNSTWDAISFETHNSVIKETSNGTYSLAYWDGSSWSGASKAAVFANPTLAGLYVTFLGGLGGNGNGLNPVFIANSLRNAAESKNASQIMSNIEKDIWLGGGINGSTLKDKENEDFKSTGYGISAGAKIYSNQKARLGVFAGFAGNNLEQGKNKADTTDIEFGLYSGYFGEKINVKGLLGYGIQSISAKNDASNSKADYDTSAIRAAAEVEYILGIIRPFIGLEGGYISNTEIKEKTNGTESGAIKADSYIRVKGLLGIKVEENVNTFSLSGKLFVGSIVAGAKPEYTTNADEKITATKEADLYFGLGAGIEVPLNDKVSAYVHGDINIGEDFLGYAANVGASYKF